VPVCKVADSASAERGPSTATCRKSRGQERRRLSGSPGADKTTQRKLAVAATHRHGIMMMRCRRSCAPRQRLDAQYCILRHTRDSTVWVRRRSGASACTGSRTAGWGLPGHRAEREHPGTKRSATKRSATKRSATKRSATKRSARYTSKGLAHAGQRNVRRRQGRRPAMALRGALRPRDSPPASLSSNCCRQQLLWAAAAVGSSCCGQLSAAQSHRPFRSAAATDLPSCRFGALRR
jgi:hypothetical protein